MPRTAPLTRLLVITFAAALSVTGSSNDHLPTEPSGFPQAVKQGSPLKVTPSQLEFAGIGLVVGHDRYGNLGTATNNETDNALRCLRP